MGKRNIFILCFLLLGIIGKAQSPVTYSGNQLPTSVGWNELKFDNTVNKMAGDPVVATVQGNILQLNATSSGKYTQLGWYKANTGFNANVGYTVEIKAKVTESDGAFTIQGFDASGIGFRLLLYPNQLVESTGSLVSNVLNTDSNSDTFHTYRIAVAPDKTYIFRDGNLIGSFANTQWEGEYLIAGGNPESGASTKRNALFRVPDGALNLFPNEDFEDPFYHYFPTGDVRNDTALVYNREDNMAPDWHPFWGARVRLQYSIQYEPDYNYEAGPNFARSGKYSLRYFNCFGDNTQYGADINKAYNSGRGYNCNLNANLELEPDKTYTFSFWYHFAKWDGDRLRLLVKNGNTTLFDQQINNAIFPEFKNGLVTFTTTPENHTLSILTERYGNTPGVLYLDDLFLFEGTPLLEFDNSYLFFGKSNNTEAVDVEIESVSYDNTGAYSPDGSLLIQKYEKKTAPLMTVWGENLQATDPVFDEYPRPQLQRDHWVNLNGIWNFIRKENRKDFGTYNPNETYRKEILVPFPIESALSGIADTDYTNFEKTYAYQRKFTVAPEDAGKQIILHFGAVDWECYVFVNGEQVIHHTGGYDPFSADITDKLTGSGEQELVVQIYDPTKGGNPRGKQDPQPSGIWYTPSSGIWQTVWYEAVNPAYIDNLSIVPDVDRNAVKILLDVKNASGATAEVSIIDGNIIISTQTVTIGQEVSLPINNPKLWSPDSPFLYGLSITVSKDGKTADQVSSYFGMRKISKEMLRGKPYMFLNNEPIFHWGPLDQGFWPDGLHTPPSYEALRFDLEKMKELGMNMVRKHIKVEPARWFYYCDSIGLMVWQDMPTPAGLNPQIVVGSGTENAVKENFLNETEAIVKSLKNYPSIVMWVPYNEGWGQYAGSDDPSKGDPTHTINGVNRIKALDDTRLINPSSGWTSYEVGDIIDRHNYSEPYLHNNPYNERASVCGETGGYGFVIDGHIWSRANNPYTSINSPEELANKYKLFNAQARSITPEGINGIVYTQISDVEEEVNGFFTYDRKVDKLALKDSVAGKVLKEGITWIKSNALSPTILKTASFGGEIWKYVTGNMYFNPANNWNQTNFDDSSWKEGCSGFGQGIGYINTEWNTGSIYLRKMVHIPDMPLEERDNLIFSIFHDENYEFYINGRLASQGTGYVTGYKTIDISTTAKNTINWGGENLFAIHVIQTAGAQYIDLGIFQEIPLNKQTITPEPVWIEVSNAEQFLAIRNNLSGFYKLTADIDLYNAVNYEPIGNANNPFRGYLNGAGFTVKCPEINDANADMQGLFGYAEDAYFTDLRLTGIIVRGNNNIGSLLGGGKGVTIQRTAVEKPCITGSNQTGGMIGTAFSGKATRVEDCYVTDGEVISKEGQAAGLIGTANNTRIERSYYAGTVEVQTRAADRDGSGIISRIESGLNSLRGVVSLATSVTSGSANEFISYGNNGTRLNEFLNCYTYNGITLSSYVNSGRTNLLPRATSAQKRPLADFKSQALYESIGWNFENLWIIPEGGGYPVFKYGYTSILPVNVQKSNNLKAYKSGEMLVLEVFQPASVWIYNVSGILVERTDVEKTKQLTLPKGIYIIKSVYGRNAEATKIIN